MCGDLADGKLSHPLEDQTVDFLITLVLIGLVVVLFPYILAALVVVSGLFIAGITIFVMVVKSLFKRN
jgi:Flp pilus assembly protein TadB